ncbi:E3 ubiquitin-protein transferase MAEA-like isoform X1 [Amphibalanus amphitrite]|uniref:E3 ubiquitin-protein transferase MAEA-like isoform X1 n=1 Tax=Amphibalanus amphitrite TaxID=1232801 RepID=UPI001C90A992|nr:E3 ubiquitin-protein transferase MAEA-like isoform X1 [Amphibalanus amphitrite]XP_043217557.1 E3 ubiquitin-protein transferase MAEA-like isoform X1 [Amphibalanus amphitrite]XP_043217558.1 E3 ubiquitin-protein transferase MAEA-like isoform X1 [Amphibalanus amphitrite]XP_043217559.1 E3 ubiquitin-protein transferase MAEA-like isoform X1 [Amphibalanus amphitrite]
MVDGRGNNSMRLAEVKVLEHPTLKVPYEMLNKKFRSSQKTLDRELAHFCSSASDLESSLHHSSVTVADVSRLLGSVTDRLRALKRKSEESICDELQSAELCRRRLQHLMEYGSQSAGLLSQWKRQRLDRLLVDHFVRCGFYELAVNLARHSQIEPLTNIDIFLVASQVENSLRRKDTGPALAWCYDNKSKLRKGRSKLELRLRQQEFIELVRAERRIEAVMHARKHLSNMDDYQGEDIQSCMALLAFPVDTDIAPYCDLFSERRWHQLIAEFREENFRIYQLSSVSVFRTVLQDGLAALKTHQCYRQDGQGNPDCPVCQPPLNELARPLPFSHCTQSRLLCALSGKPIDEHNPPMVLPNGNVYGRLALQGLAADMKGRVICPRTQEVYPDSQLEKVFVM